MSIFINWFIYAVAIFIAANILPGIHINNFMTALFAAVILGILNILIKPILILLTLPINILTLGLFTFVINAAIILLTDYFVDGFEVDGFWWAVLFGIILSIISSILLSFTND